MSVAVRLRVPAVERFESSRHARDGGRLECRLTEVASSRRDGGLDVLLKALELHTFERLTEGGDLVRQRRVEVNVERLCLREDGSEGFGNGEKLSEGVRLVLQSTQPLGE